MKQEAPACSASETSTAQRCRSPTESSAESNQDDMMQPWLAPSHAPF